MSSGNSDISNTKVVPAVLHARAEKHSQLPCSLTMAISPSTSISRRSRPSHLCLNHHSPATSPQQRLRKHKRNRAKMPRARTAPIRSGNWAVAIGRKFGNVWDLVLKRSLLIRVSLVVAQYPCRPALVVAGLGRFRRTSSCVPATRFC